MDGMELHEAGMDVGRGKAGWRGVDGEQTQLHRHTHTDRKGTETKSET